MCKYDIEFVELCLRNIVVRQPRGALHLANDWVERAVSALRRTEIPQTYVWLRSETFQQCRRQSRLADTSLARQENHLALADLCLRPAPQQQFEFFFSSDKLGQAARVHRLEPALHRTRAQRRPSTYRTGDALEVPCSEALKLKEAAE